MPGIFKRRTTPQYGYDESDTKPHPVITIFMALLTHPVDKFVVNHCRVLIVAARMFNLSGSKRRIRQPSLTLVTLQGEREVKSGSLPLQKINISSSDYCEKTMEELLQESYVDMKA